MFISVAIRLGPGEFAGDLSGNSEQIADRVIKAVGGNKDVDTCHVSILDAGIAGVEAPMQPGSFMPPMPMTPPVSPPILPTPTLNDPSDPASYPPQTPEE